MISNKTNVNSTSLSQSLLAFTYVVAKDDTISIAYKLSNDKNKSAIKFAEELIELPKEKGVNLALDTLKKFYSNTIKQSKKESTSFSNDNKEVIRK